MLNVRNSGILWDSFLLSSRVLKRSKVSRGCSLMWPVSLVSCSSTMHTDTSHATSSCLVFSISLPSLLPCIGVQMLICEPSVTILLHSNQNENDAGRYLFCSKAEQWILTPRKMFATSINYQAAEECLAMLNQCICCGCAVSVSGLQ